MFKYIKEFILILALLIIAIVSAFFIPPSANEEGSAEKSTNSFVVSGSDKKFTEYLSFNFANTTKSDDPIDKISLSDFLGKDTTTQTRNIVTDEVNDVSNTIINELKQYGNNVGMIHNKYLPKTLDQIVVLDKFITSPLDLSAHDELISLSGRYIDASAELLSIETPPSINQFHKDFAGVYKTIGNALKTLFEDTITEDNLLNYNKSTSKYVEAYLNIAQYLRISGVLFDETEPGSLFTLPF